MKTNLNGILTLLLAFVVHLSFAQSKSISGNVTDQNGLPLPGVNISVDGTSTGTQTDFDGNYTIQGNIGQILLFSYIGQKTSRQTIGTENTINVQLQEDAEALEEVVVTGVASGTSRKKVGVAVSSVKAEDLQEVGTTSLDQALQGKVAGTVIQSTSGQPGQQQNIILRSINSLNSSQPLILIDGIQILSSQVSTGGNSNLSSRLSDIDFNNIERVETISGAAAGTIYGAQGANGVINIISKKGRAGKSVVSIRSSVGVTSVAANSDDIISDFHGYSVDDSGFIVSGTGTRVTELNDEFQYLSSAPEARDINGTDIGSIGINDRRFQETTFDPLETIFREAYSTSVGASVSGGSEKIRYSISGNRTSQESILINGDYVKFDARLNLGIDITDKLTLNARFDAINSNNDTGANTDQASNANILSSVYQTNQYIDFNVLNADGDRVVQPDLTDANSSNPLFFRDITLRNDEINRNISNINLNYKPLDILELDLKYGFDDYTQDATFFQENQSDHQQAAAIGTNIDGRINFSTIQESFQNLLISSNLKLDFKEDLNIDADISSTTTLTFDWRDNLFQQNSVSGTNIPFGVFGDFNINQAQTKTFNSFFESPFRTYGFLINQKFDFGSLFGFSAGLRRDSSNRFGSGQDFTFPRADAYFNIADVLDSESIKTLKIRAAYGEAGIQPQFGQNILAFASTTAGNQSPLTLPATSQNSGLEVETSSEFEIGIDYRLSTNNENWLTGFSGSVNYYDRETEGAIFNVEQAPSAGTTSFFGNGYDVVSDGVEVSLDAQIANTKNFDWNFGVRFSSGKSTLENISSGQPLSFGNNFILEEGQEIGSLSVQQALTSLDQTDADGNRYISVADEGNFTVASSGYVVDKNTGSVQLSPERRTSGSSQPDYVLTFLNDFKINNFINLSFQWDLFEGLDVYNRARQWLYQSGLQVHSDTANPVSFEDPTGTVQTGAFRGYYNSLYNTNDPVSEFVEDGSFARLRNISLTFNINKVAKLDFIKTLDITISGRNLITITDYKGLDPEASRNFGNTFQRGFDEFTFPNTKSVNFGLNITL